MIIIRSMKYGIFGFLIAKKEKCSGAFSASFKIA